MIEPDFHPRFDGAEQAIAAGRRRRTQRQLGGASAVAAIAVLAMLIAAGPFRPEHGRDSIQVAGDPAPTAEPTSEDSSSPAPTAEPTAEPSPEPSANRGGGPQPLGGGDSGENSDPYSHPRPEESDEPSARVSPQPVRSVVAYGDGEDCAAPGTLALTEIQWCGRYSGDTTVKRGGVATIAVDLCRPAAQGDGTVEFSDEDGVEMSITDVWDSRDGRKVATTREQVLVKAGTCLRWTTSLDTRDREGFRVRPGDYGVQFGFNYTNGSYASSGGGLTVVE